MAMNALIFGVGGPTPLGIAKSLRLKARSSELRLVGVDGDRFAPGLYNHDLFDKTCLNGFTRDPDYWKIIEEIIDREAIDVAFVVPEAEVLEWAKRQKEGELPCKALIPDYDVAGSLYDKFRCYELLQHTTLVPESISIDRNTPASDVGEKLRYPYWVRKASGAGAIGAFKVTCDEDLENWLSINPALDGFIASEFLPGRNYACKMLYADGALLRVGCGERIDYLLASAAPSGISGMCARGRLINDSGLIAKSALAIRTIFDHHGKAPHGMFTVDFKEDKNGDAKLTEINIRHVSFTLAFALAGANFAFDTLELLSKGELAEAGYKEYVFEGEPHFIRGVDSEIFIISDGDLVRG